MTDPQQAASLYLAANGLSAMNPKAFLFDMDGTLYDSMRNHAGAWYRMITEQGIPATPEEFFLYEGSTGADTINMIFRRTYGREATRQEIERMYARKSELFAAMPQPQIMPGARRLVDYVRNLPWHPAVVLVTGSGQGSLLDKLNDDFDGAFPLDMRVTARNVTYGKPHPHPYLKGMEIASASPCEQSPSRMRRSESNRPGGRERSQWPSPQARSPPKPWRLPEHISYTDQWRSARRHFLILWRH